MQTGPIEREGGYDTPPLPPVNGTTPGVPHPSAMPLIRVPQGPLLYDIVPILVRGSSSPNSSTYRLVAPRWRFALAHARIVRLRG